ncbi:hypothetical protein ACOSP7_031075 [Xanthoceras sorbifolium]
MEPEAILDTRWVKKGSRFVKESIVQWKRLPWDDERFINMNLEDKVSMKDGGIDKPKRSQRVPKKNQRFLT